MTVRIDALKRRNKKRILTQNAQNVRVNPKDSIPALKELEY